MTTKRISISAPPDFVMTIGRAIHNHSVVLTYVCKNGHVRKEVFSHASQMEVIKFIQSRLTGEGATTGATVAQQVSEKLLITIEKTDPTITLEYPLPSSLPLEFRNDIYKKFLKELKPFVHLQKKVI